MEALPLLGLACVIYSLVEIALAARRPSPPAFLHFGAVDEATGRPIEVRCDRRVRTRRSPQRTR